MDICGQHACGEQNYFFGFYTFQGGVWRGYTSFSFYFLLLIIDEIDPL